MRSKCNCFFLLLGQMIGLQLRSVLERVKHVLNEAGLSTELPEPCFEEVTLTYRPPNVSQYAKAYFEMIMVD